MVPADLGMCGCVVSSRCNEATSQHTREMVVCVCVWCVWCVCVWGGGGGQRSAAGVCVLQPISLLQAQVMYIYMYIALCGLYGMYACGYMEYSLCCFVD